MNWESKVVFEHKSLFYLYDANRKEVLENKNYLSIYKEFCGNAVKNAPVEISQTIAEEFNDRIREHFSIAFKAFKKEKRNWTLLQAASILVVFVLIVLLFRNCGGG